MREMLCKEHGILPIPKAYAIQRHMYQHCPLQARYRRFAKRAVHRYVRRLVRQELRRKESAKEHTNEQYDAI